MEHIVKILSITAVTHNVHCLRLQKPEGYTFVPGQATDAAINKPGWEKEKRPFTFTCLNTNPYLEFTIKSYDDHQGVTKQIGLLNAGDELIIGEPWGAIEYKGEGFFIAGGAGITPFVAILRQLYKEKNIAGNKLFFSNKTRSDIIYEQELKDMLGENAIYIVTDEKTGPHRGYIDAAFLEKNVGDFKKQFYICGPDAMVKAISEMLIARGADPNAVVFEK